jgi:hypothetical protein
MLLLLRRLAPEEAGQVSSAPGGDTVYSVDLTSCTRV